MVINTYQWTVLSDKTVWIVHTEWVWLETRLNDMYSFPSSYINIVWLLLVDRKYTQQIFCEVENRLEQGEYDCCAEVYDSIRKFLDGCMINTQED